LQEILLQKVASIQNPRAKEKSTKMDLEHLRKLRKKIRIILLKIDFLTLV